MNQEEIEQLKNDSEFQENLKRLEGEMKSENSIAKGYQVLDAMLVLESKEDDVNEVFTFIVNTAFDRLAEFLSSHRKFDMSDPEEYATARAIYEHGIQRYSEGDKKGAKEIFLVLYHMLTVEELKDAMMVHACAVMSETPFDVFIDEFVDVSEIDPEDPMAFFITTFVQPVDMLMAMWADHVKSGKEELKVLENSEKNPKG